MVKFTRQLHPQPRQPDSPGDFFEAFNHAGKVLDSLGDITFDMV